MWVQSLVSACSDGVHQYTATRRQIKCPTLQREIEAEQAKIEQLEAHGECMSECMGECMSECMSECVRE